MMHTNRRKSWMLFPAAIVVCSLTQLAALADSPVELKQPTSAVGGTMNARLAGVSGDAAGSAKTDSHSWSFVTTAAERRQAVTMCCNWCVPRWTLRVDALLWWTKGNRVPPLVTTSPDGTDRADAGVLYRPGTSVLHGAELIDDNYRPGGRVTLGYWLDECHANALEFVWFSLGDGANSGNYYNQSTGSPILARPFFDVQTGQQNSELVAFPNIVEGGIQVSTSSELHSVAALLRQNLARGCCERIDLLAGYRFLRFREGLTIEEDLTSTDPGGVVAIGTTFDVWDSFSTGNDFNGAELGIAYQRDGGSWSWDILAKLAVGNMRQVVDVDGFTRVAVPAGSPVTNEGGLLALSTNIGRASHNKFAMIPELNLNVQYQLTERLDLSMGYSLLWVTNVARSGDQIDFAVNPSQLPGNGGNLNGSARPAARFEDTSMWVQGIHAGVVYEF